MVPGKGKQAAASSGMDFFHRWESVRDAKLDLVTVPFTNCVVQAAPLNDHQILDICQFREGHLSKGEKNL